MITIAEANKSIEEAFILLEKKKVSGFIAPIKNKMILLMRRTKDDQWGLPGGQVDKKEKNSAAVKRETKEETNMLFNKVKKVAKVKGKNKNIHLYKTKIKNHFDDFKLDNEHYDYGFFKISDLKSLIAKRTNNIPVRDERGNRLESFTLKDFKLHKSAKLFILNH